MPQDFEPEMERETDKHYMFNYHSAKLTFGLILLLINKLFPLAVFLQKAICRVPHREHKKGNGKILVAGKRLNLGVRGPGEEPSWGETRSSGTGGSHPGQES